MKLWTIQAAPAVEDFKRQGVLRGQWPRDPGWRAAYQWMSCEMVARGLGTEPSPPVWAWHSCRGWGQPPDQQTLSALLSEADWERGQCILEFNAPDESVPSLGVLVLERAPRSIR